MINFNINYRQMKKEKSPTQQRRGQKVSETRLKKLTLHVDRTRVGEEGKEKATIKLFACDEFFETTMNG